MKFFLFFPSFLLALQYYISFQYTIQNNQIINEKLEYSRCMDEKKLPIITTIKYFNKYNSIKDIFKYESENIIDILSKNGVIIHNSQKIINYYSLDKVKITYLPKRFDIIFIDGYIEFRLLGE